MKTIQKNKKYWFKGLVIALVFTISLLDLSVDFQRDEKGEIDLRTLSISSTNAIAQRDGTVTCYSTIFYYCGTIYPWGSVYGLRVVE